MTARWATSRLYVDIDLLCFQVDAPVRMRRMSPICHRFGLCPVGLRLCENHTLKLARLSVSACSITRRLRRSALSDRRRLPNTFTRAEPPKGKRVRALGGAKNHLVVMADCQRLWFSRRALYGDFGSSSGGGFDSRRLIRRLLAKDRCAEDCFGHGSRCSDGGLS